MSYRDKRSKTEINPKNKNEAHMSSVKEDVIRQVVAARIDKNLTQSELARRCGMDQADLSKLESGNRNPSLAVLEKVAAGLDMQLVIRFIPKPTKRGK